MATVEESSEDLQPSDASRAWREINEAGSNVREKVAARIQAEEEATAAAKAAARG